MYERLRRRCARGVFERLSRSGGDGDGGMRVATKETKRRCEGRILRNWCKMSCIKMRCFRRGRRGWRSSSLEALSFLSLFSSSSSSFEIEDEYLVVERRADEMGEEEHKENQDENTALVVVATLDYVIADKLQGELLCGDKGNGQSFDSEKYAFNEATQTYEFMPKTIERAYCFNVCVLGSYRGQGFARQIDSPSRSKSCAELGEIFIRARRTKQCAGVALLRIVWIFRGEERE